MGKCHTHIIKLGYKSQLIIRFISLNFQSILHKIHGKKPKSTKVNNKYVIAAILNRQETYNEIRKVIRKYLDRTAKITEEEIENYMKNDIIRRDVIDSDEAIDAQRYVKQKIRQASKK